MSFFLTEISQYIRLIIFKWKLFPKTNYIHLSYILKYNNGVVSWNILLLFYYHVNVIWIYLINIFFCIHFRNEPQSCSFISYCACFVLYFGCCCFFSQPTDISLRKINIRLVKWSKSIFLFYFFFIRILNVLFSWFSDTFRTPRYTLMNSIYYKYIDRYLIIKYKQVIFFFFSS